MDSASSGGVAPRILSGLSAVAPQYDGFIVDLWGVMHNGVAAFPAALEALAALRRMGKKVMLLSNAPRRIGAVAARCAELGINSQHYDALYTSGEACWLALKQWDDPLLRPRQRRIFSILADMDRPMLQQLDITCVDRPADADLFLNIGIRHQGDRVDHYRDILDEAAQHKLLMLCANPDLIVMRGSAIEICAGALAQAYEAGGGQVIYFGKPHAGVYHACFREMAMKPRQVLAIGDSFRTDITGANRQGMDSVLICDGIEAPRLLNAQGAPDAEKLIAESTAQQAFPTYALKSLCW